MGLFRVRKKRDTVELPVRLYLKERRTGKTTSKYLSGTIVNLSSRGACLMIKKVLLDGRHIFFQTQKTAEHLLQIVGLESEERQVTPKAFSLWMDSGVHHGSPAFKLGVQFTEQNAKLSDSVTSAELHSS